VRIAIVSDIHGNMSALEAVRADLQQMAPDLIVHGGDLAHAGADPAGVIDQIRSLGWQGVLGNTDEMLFSPVSFQEFADRTPGVQPLRAAIEEMTADAREALGEERLAWLRTLPRVFLQPSFALVHASPASLWHAPIPEAGDPELESVYGPLGRNLAVYGHIHRSYIRRLLPTTEAAGVAGGTRTVVNTGSVSLSHDGDRRASYLLLDHAEPQIRRVEYDIDRELRALAVCGLAHAAWTAKILASARPQLP